jgi:26S proteasome regulatory subunit N10
MDSDGAGPSGSGGGGGGSFEFGVDPSMDPELAMALRMSLEEEQARQRAVDGTSAAPDLAAVPEATEETPLLAEESAPLATSAMPSRGSLVLPGADPITGTGPAATDESEEALLQQAIALSKAGNIDSINDEDVEMGDNADDDEDMDEEEAIARAIEMSLKSDQEQQPK